MRLKTIDRKKKDKTKLKKKTGEKLKKPSKDKILTYVKKIN